MLRNLRTNQKTRPAALTARSGPPTCALRGRARVDPLEPDECTEQPKVLDPNSDTGARTHATRVHERVRVIV